MVEEEQKPYKTLSELSAEVKQHSATHANTSKVGEQLLPTEERLGYAQLFFSYDIVNSTLYKDINRNNWAKILKELLESVKSKWEQADNAAVFWKTIGDEIVFTKNIQSPDLLYKTLRHIHSTLNSINDKLSKNELFSGQTYSTAEHLDKLSLKATAWIAEISEDHLASNDSTTGSKNKEEVVNSSAINVAAMYSVTKNYEQIEYIGPDIDTGFRIAEYSAKNRLVISFELACLMLELVNENIELPAYDKTLNKNEIKLSISKKLHLLTLKKLKGIWNNRYYPIIWYEPASFNFKESLEYDQYAEYEIINEYQDNIKGKNKNFPEKKLFLEIEKSINKIRDNIPGMQKKVETLAKCIRSGKLTYDIFKQLEVHYAVVCYKLEQNQIHILVIEKETTSSKKWEFGCVSAEKDSSCSDTIQREYKKKYNIELELTVDLARKEDPQPVPLALYEIGYNKKGIIIMAKVINADNIVESSKYPRHKFITEADIETYNEFNSVNDFKDTLKKAFSRIKENQQNITHSSIFFFCFCLQSV